ncbi:Protein abhd8 [Bulinus truncatus]|nr:Protein abhd8 [Bulinus truncatus]
MSGRNRVRVGPAEINGEIIEIRPSRKLRIQHLNARPRDEKFEKEMQIYSGLRNKSISPGPLTVPKQKTISQNQSSSDSTAGQLQSIKSDSANSHMKKKGGFSNEKVITFQQYINGTEKKPHSSQSFNHGIQEHSIKLYHDFPETTEDLCLSTTLSSDSSVHDFFKSQGNSLSAGLSPMDVDSIKSRQSAKVDKDLVIFFIHGVGGSSDIWSLQTQYLSRLGYEIITPDLIGHGFSCAPRHSKAYHFKEIAADIEEIFDKYCKRRNIIIGHSYGASFASYLARRRPKRVTKLILVSGGPPTPLAPQPGIFKLPYLMLVCVKPCLECGFYKGAFHKSKTPFISKKEAFNIPAYVLQSIMNGQDWPDGDELFHNWLTCPCLLIYGAEDQLVSLSDEEEMAQVIFDSQLVVIKDASHMVMVEAPDEVNLIIENFIKKTDDPHLEAIPSTSE